MTTVDQARDLSQSKLAQALPRRWSHVQAVGRRAGEVGRQLLSPADAEIVEAAGWLHDIGYAPDIVDTGFHPLDGARWLKAQGIDDRVSGLVAYHSCAPLEAEERGLRDALEAEFHNEGSELTAVLLYADMTTGPDGQAFDVEERLNEIERRYGPGDLITRFIRRARPQIVTTARTVESKLA